MSKSLGAYLSLIVIAAVYFVLIGVNRQWGNSAEPPCGNNWLAGHLFLKHGNYDVWLQSNCRIESATIYPRNFSPNDSGVVFRSDH